MKNEHNGVSICDRLESGWTIEGYPEPLTEARCEEIMDNDRKIRVVPSRDDLNEHDLEFLKDALDEWQQALVYSGDLSGITQHNEEIFKKIQSMVTRLK